MTRSPVWKRSIPLLISVLAGSIGGVATSVSAAPESIPLPGDAAYPESITSTADGTLYVSSFASGGVMRVRPGADAEIWIKPGAFETRSTFGVLADKKNGILWVCSNDLSALGVKGPSEVKGAALKGFDLKTGEGRISAPFPVSPAICNDIALGPDGSAYVTNTLGPHILQLKPGSQSLEVWKTDPLFAPEGKEAGLDGIAFGKDGHLYVNTFTKAQLFRVTVTDGAAGAVTPLTPSRALVLADGLRPMADGSFLMAEGGGRLDRVTVEGDRATIETLKDGIAGGVTAVTQVGATAWITVGQLAVLTDPSKKGSKPELPFRIHAVPLKLPWAVGHGKN
ncbi:SMP-30/gluconolactonase/LRE family protein [Methylobacterium komagatae]